MAPADLRKEGSAYDLPLALGIMAASVGWLLILQDQASAATEAAEGWREAMNDPIQPRPT